ncbi:MsnO8 family LLM class oxidoreductase [Streptomyces coffeae]|uniref:MsnO8 family LLM class oxidoreductase n=1 Tax=Streptomyces coffeae TaxID=621382 RepID=A0ABS1NGP8_9ACTN|nr:MsnO8 family LLM class oxidoreductase [Streptomyces coffeae]MBL1099245.1 MsnO8 family LLM class oxidoreductase [Streptomyces coffeae]
MIDLPLSALEVAIVEAGTSAGDALRNCTQAAAHLDSLGYKRLWFAEHHHSPAIGAFPPPIMTSHIASATTDLRVGSGGVMAPNHAPVTIAEQFTTLAALHPGRVDLGLGRGPGTFHEGTARALRRGAPPASDDEYRRDVEETLELLLEAEFGELPEPWLLVSSEAGASLAAALGLPVALAHHIRPENTLRAAGRYRARFTPSRWSAAPRILVCVETVCADTEERAADLTRPMAVVKADLLQGRSEAPFPSVEEAARHRFSTREQQALDAFGAQQAYGTPDVVSKQLQRIAAETQADELMLVTPVFGLEDRMRSFELVR